MNDELEKEFEGCRLTAYPDPGTGGEPYTIGYGHTGGVKPGDTITQAQAEQFLLDDLRAALDAVHSSVKVPLTDDEESALVDLVYNIGIGNFGHSTLLRLLNAGDYEGAAAQFAAWNRASGKVMAGLTRRRAAEAAMFRAGIGKQAAPEAPAAPPAPAPTKSPSILSAIFGLLQSIFGKKGSK